MYNMNIIHIERCKFSSVTQSCLTVCDPMDCSSPGFPVHYPELAQTHVKKKNKKKQLMSIKSMMPSNHLILHHPLLLLPSIFIRIRVFSNESVLHIRWPKYWSFSFTIRHSNEYSGLISFRLDWFDLLAVQGKKNIFWVCQHFPKLFWFCFHFVQSD